MATITSTSCGTSNIVQGAGTTPNNSYYLNSNPSGFITIADLTSKFVTQQDSLPSGASLYRINFPSTLVAAPSTITNQLLNSVSGVSSFTHIIKSIDTSGFYIEFSNNLSTGYSLMSNYVSGSEIVGAFLEAGENNNGIIIHQRDALDSGSNNYRINFPSIIFAPTSLSTELLNVDTGSPIYSSIIRAVDTSGFNIQFTNTLGTGYYLMSTYLSGNSGIISVNSYITNNITSGGSGSIDESFLVHLTGEEVIVGNKTFLAPIQAYRINDTGSAGGNPVLDCTDRTLLSANGDDSVHFNNRQLHDGSEIVTVDWNTKTLSGNWLTNTSPTTANHIINKGYLDNITGQITSPSNVVFTTGTQNIAGTKGFIDLLKIYSGETIYDNSLSPIVDINSSSGTFRLYYPNSAFIFMDNNGVFRSSLNNVYLNVNSGTLHDSSLQIALDWDDRQLSGQWQTNTNPSSSGHIINKGYLDSALSSLSVSNVVFITGDQRVSGVKTFSNTGINLTLFSGNLNNYQQINVINSSTGALASADLVATNNIGNETTGYVNIGINSSTYTGGYVGASGDSYLFAIGNDLLVGNVVSGKRLLLFAEQAATGTGMSTVIITNRRVQIIGSGDFSQGLTVSGRSVLTGVSGMVGGSGISLSGVTINIQNDYDQFILMQRIFN